MYCRFAGTVQANADGTVNARRNVAIKADATHSAKADAFALAGGIVHAGAGGEAIVRVSPTVTAYTGTNARVRALRSFTLHAHATPKAHAETFGFAASAKAGIGASVALAETKPTIRSYIGTGSEVIAGTYQTGAPTLSFQGNARLALPLGTSLTFVSAPVTGYEDITVYIPFFDFSTFGFIYIPVVIGQVPATYGPSQIIRSSGSWFSDGFEVGQTIRVEGSSQTANNGTFTITGLTDTTLSLSGVFFTDESNVTAVTVTGGRRDTISRNTGSWRDDGFKAGQNIRVSGTPANDGVYRIQSVSSDGKTLNLTTFGTLTNESVGGADCRWPLPRTCPCSTLRTSPSRPSPTSWVAPT
jgi:hypothetical protein